LSGTNGFNYSGDGGGGGAGGGGYFGGIGQAQGVNLRSSGGGQLATIGTAVAGGDGTTAGGAATPIPVVSGSWWSTGTYGQGAGASGSGVQGVVVIRYLGFQRATGGTVTSSGGYTIHTFTTSGTLTA
jgi:hypothetical protein